MTFDDAIEMALELYARGDGKQFVYAYRNSNCGPVVWGVMSVTLKYLTSGDSSFAALDRKGGWL